MKHKLAAFAIVAGAAIVVMLLWAAVLPAQPCRWAPASLSASTSDWSWSATKPNQPVPSSLESCAYTGFQLPGLPAWPLWQDLDICPGGEYIAAATTSGLQVWRINTPISANVPGIVASMEFSADLPNWPYPGKGENKFFEVAVACDRIGSVLKIASIGRTGIQVHVWSTTDGGALQRRWTTQQASFVEHRGGHWYERQLYTIQALTAGYGLHQYDGSSGALTVLDQRFYFALAGTGNLLVVGYSGGWAVRDLDNGAAAITSGAGSAFAVEIWRDGDTYLATQDQQRVTFRRLDEATGATILIGSVMIPGVVQGLEWSDGVGLHVAGGVEGGPWENRVLRVVGSEILDLTPGQLLDHAQTTNANFATPRTMVCADTPAGKRCYDSHWVAISPFALSEPPPPPPCGGAPGGSFCDGFETGNTEEWK